MNAELVIARLFHYFVGDDARQPPLTPRSDGVTAEVLIAPDGRAEALAPLTLTAQSVVFAPSHLVGQLDGIAADVVTYDAEPSDPREWTFAVDGLTVRREGYTDATFAQISCPTVVSVESPGDYEHFAGDADRARGTGIFPDLILHPLVAIADQCAFGAVSCAAATHGRAYVEGDRLRSGPYGGEFPAAGHGARGCAGCLDAWITQEELALLRSQRPQLARYLAVVRVMRQLRDRIHGDLRVSGFGWRANEALSCAVIEPVDAPVLVAGAGAHWVVSPTTNEVARVGLDVIRVIEVLSAASYDDPVEAVGAHLGVSLTTSRSVVEQLGPLLARLTPAADGSAVPQLVGSPR